MIASTSVANQPRRPRTFRDRAWARPVLALTFALVATTVPVPADDGPVEIRGKAILQHPSTVPILEAAKLIKAGKFAEVRKASAKDVRDEWASMSTTDRREETERAQKRAPDPKTFAAEISARGVLTIYGESAKLFVPSADGNTTVMAFVSLEGGKWLVTGGPMAIDTTPVVETAPALKGAQILDHEIGKILLDYARAIEAGKIEGAMAFATAEARKHRLELSTKERKESDEYRRASLPKVADLPNALRDGGTVTFEGEKTYLNVITSTQEPAPGGGTTFTSTTFAMLLALEAGHWKIGS